MALKPENALKRAEELIGVSFTELIWQQCYYLYTTPGLKSRLERFDDDRFELSQFTIISNAMPINLCTKFSLQVGQKNNALQTLHDTITKNKRQQRNWTKALEQVMYKYVDLAVEMKQARKLKDALINYRNTCQQVNVGSLEEVIKYLVDAASERAEAARAEAAARLEDVADLEAEASPEEMVLSYVSGEKTADRTDREVVTPWFKFLWESHRNILDFLRNNARLESLYAVSATRAFAFCLRYKRTTEFRRLCDILRNHLTTLIKYKDQNQGRDRTDLSQPSTWELYVDVRFEQLKAACELELWAEAFRSVEDIQTLIALAPKGIKAPRASLMAQYYSFLTQIFGRSEARLYNAYAWYRLFTFNKAYNKALTSTDLKAMAANVVLSALSVAPYDAASSAAGGTAGGGTASPTSVVGQSDEARLLEQERAGKMAVILGFSVDRRDGRAFLSRSALLADIERKGLLQLVPEQVRQIYSVVEGGFNPLQLCQELKPLLDALKPLGEELAPSAACPPGSASLDSYVPHLQQVSLARTVKQLSEVYSVMKVDSLSALAPFGWSFGQSEALIVDAVRHGYVHARFDHRNGTVHFGGRDNESEKVRAHLSLAAKRLARAMAMIVPKEVSEAERMARCTAAAQRALDAADEENKRALARKQIIENRKEEVERMLLEREQEAEAARAVAEAQAREAEERRQAAERVRREEERIRKEMAEDEQNRLRAELAMRGKKIGDAEMLDMNALKAELQREEDRNAQELRRKLTRLTKQMDHLERARREEEAPLREAEAAKRAVEEEAAWSAEQEQAKAAHHAAWERDLELKGKVARMSDDAQEFASKVQERRAAELEVLRAERERLREAQRVQRKADRELARKREFVRRCRIEIEERHRAEDEQKRKEEEEKAKREAAEKQRKLDEMAEKQRQREAEIEARGRDGAAQDAAPAASAAKSTGGYVPPHLRGKTSGPSGGGGGGGGDDRSKAWRPSSSRGQEDGGRGDSTRSGSGGGGGAYRPPGARGGSRW